MPLMTISEYAKHRGISQPRVSQLKGRLEETGCMTEGGKIRSEKADEYLDSSLNQAKSRNKGTKQITANSEVYEPDSKSKKVVSESEARARKLLAEAKRQELALKKDEGSIVDAKEVEFAAFNRGRRFRDNMLAIADRIAATVAAETNEFECRRIVRSEIETALREESGDA